MTDCHFLKGSLLGSWGNPIKAFSSHNVQLHTKNWDVQSSRFFRKYSNLGLTQRNVTQGYCFLSTQKSDNLGGFYHYIGRKPYSLRFQIRAQLEVANAIDVINDLGFDTLTFLAVTVLVVPAFRIIKASPILGFFCAGVVLNQFGLIRNLLDVKLLSEWGILFLLFEMGLELSLARLKALAKFAFGMGLTQVVLSTLAFTAFKLPPNGVVGTKILQFLFNSRPDLEYGIQGFPTIKVFSPDKPPVDYQGARDVKPITEFALQQVKALLKERLNGKSSGDSSEKSESSASIAHLH